MFAVRNHGGMCCGIKHIYNFNAPVNEHTIAELKRKTKEESQCGRTRCILVEAVLITRQKNRWEKHLLDIGYKKVNSFTNRNSGNKCHVYHYNIVR